MFEQEGARNSDDAPGHSNRGAVPVAAAPARAAAPRGPAPPQRCADRGGSAPFAETLVLFLNARITTEERLGTSPQEGQAGQLTFTHHCEGAATGYVPGQSQHCSYFAVSQLAGRKRNKQKNPTHLVLLPVLQPLVNYTSTAGLKNKHTIIG